MKKAIKIGLLVVVVGLLAYKSVYFKKLSEVKAVAGTQKFDPVSYAQTYMSKKLPVALNQSLEFNQLLQLLQTDPNKAFSQYSHALGIGNIRFFLVHGQGEVSKILEDHTSLIIRQDSAARQVEIATEYVFGNAIRDASGLININEFNNTMDFNNVSAEINKTIRTSVLPSFKAQAKKGDRVEFAGAIELNQAHLKLDDIEIVPIQLKLAKP